MVNECGSKGEFQLNQESTFLKKDRFPLYVTVDVPQKNFIVSQNSF